MAIACSPLRNEEDSLELKLTLNREVLDGQVVLPVVGERLVEGTVLLLGDITRVTCPNRLRLVELFIGDLLDCLHLFLLLALLVLLDLLNL